VSIADFHTVQDGGVEQRLGLVTGVGVGGAAARGEPEGEVEDLLPVSGVAVEGGKTVLDRAGLPGRAVPALS
jgi:hypothetical protein